MVCVSDEARIDARLAGDSYLDWCGTMPVHRRLLDSDPGYARARAEIESYTFDRAELPPLGALGVELA